MRVKNKNEKKKLIFLVCLLLTLALGLGYAVLSEQLKLNGTVNYGTMAWDVGFTTAEDGGGSITSSPTVSEDKKSVSITCNVGTSTSSETCIAKAKVKNSSTFAVKLESNPTITYDSTYISSVTSVWSENSANIVAGDSLSANDEKEITVTITTKELTEDMLPESNLSFPVNITMDWIESNNDSVTKYIEKQLFPDMEKSLTSEDIDRIDYALKTAAPFAYQNATFFSGKTLTKIGIPVQSVNAIDNNQTFTLHIVDKTTFQHGKKATINRSIQLKLPVEQLGADKDNVNKFVYIDLIDPDTGKYLVLTENETLAFHSSTDTTTIAYNANFPELYLGDQYRIATRVNSSANFIDSDYCFYFDIYVQEEVSKQTLSSVLTGKNLSILGDSISTYSGYSNDAINTNDTIGNNAVYYTGSKSGITDVEQTWWKQTMNETGMNLLVNNSWSGSQLTKDYNSTSGSAGYLRSTNLHDNTGENAGTNPDLVALWMGINDAYAGTAAGTYSEDLINTLITDNGDSYTYATPTNFTESYIITIHKIITTYKNVKLFCFTFLPTNYVSRETIEQYNEVVRTVANHYNVEIVDLYSDSGINWSNYTEYYNDEKELHPNPIGMDKITETFINKLTEVYLN